MPLLTDTARQVISRNVWILSLVSLCTDIASEMLYPVMPVYLSSIGFSVLAIGILEGIAEATAGLSKGFFANWSDTAARRKPFVQVGYALSALSKPMLALSAWPLWVFAARTADRLGKGVRTGARDALLSDETTERHKGQVFGFHRMMDTLGAAAGPLLSLLFLRMYPGNYRLLFLLAFLPGLAAIALTLLIRERRREAPPDRTRPGLFDFLRYWGRAPVRYRQLVVPLLLFTLFNSSDVFLLLRVREAGFGPELVIGLYVFYNLVYAAAAWPLGGLADRIGMKAVLTGGLLLFAGVYAGMAGAGSLPVFIVLFGCYGLYAAATEGVAKAWITNISAGGDTATAIGAYTAFQSIGALVASSLAGWLWLAGGPSATFLPSALAAVAAALLLSRLPGTNS